MATDPATERSASGTVNDGACTAKGGTYDTPDAPCEHPPKTTTTGARNKPTAQGAISYLDKLIGAYEMHTRTRLLLAALVAALAFAFAATTASALRSLSVVGSTTVVGNGHILFIQTGGGTTVECDATVTRTISRSIPKRLGVLLGAITRIVTDPPDPDCRSSLGRLRTIIILELENAAKYRLFFEGIVGTLPRITEIKASVEGLRIGFEIELFGASLRCLYEERVRAEGRRAEEIKILREGRLTGVTIGRNLALRTAESSGFCPVEGELVGRFTTLEPIPTIILV